MSLHQPLTPELEAQARELLARLRPQAEDDLLALARLLVSTPDADIFGTTEFQARAIVHRIGAQAFATHLAEKKNGYVGSGVDCPHCGQTAKFQGHRAKTVVSVMGSVGCVRAYYYCGRCGHGVLPWDNQVGLTARSFTPGAERLVCLAGALGDSFDEAAAKILPEMAGLHVAETTVQRTTEGVGERIAAHRRGGGTFGFPHSWEWHRDAQGRTCAYVSLDLTVVRQQAADGGPAEGRMPYVAMVYNPVPELPADHPHAPPATARMQARYLAGLYELDELGVQTRRQAAQVGMDRAAVWIGLTDGGSGLEAFIRKHFARDPVLILDFWHAADHLTELAKLLYPDDEDQRQQLVQRWCHTLKHEGGARIVEVLRAYPLPAKPGVQTKHAEVVHYLASNVHRMDYPRYRANGWLIGSGAVESACKTVVGQRLKQAGMRWREYGTDAVCHVRALFKSEASQWQAFWQREFIHNTAI
jgi:hypothetical protein